MTTLATVKVKTPRVPNFLMFKDIEGKISIADVPDEQLLEIGAAWTDKLLENAAQLRENRKRYRGRFDDCRRSYLGRCNNGETPKSEQALPLFLALVEGTGAGPKQSQDWSPCA